VTPREAIGEVERELGEAGVPSPRVDAEQLVADVLGRSRTELYAGNGALEESQLSRLRSLVERRRRREPLAYILGEWGFRRLSLAIDRRVLVPRPETEIVVERALAAIRHLVEPRVVDVGTGSGAIALAIADEHQGARVLGIDSSEDALEVARLNLERTGLGGRVTLGRTDLLRDVAGLVDLVVSNPPYVREHEIRLVEPEVRDWEPRAALIGEGVGERIAAEARRVLRPSAAIVLECGDGQAPALAGHVRGLGYESVQVSRDLSDRERVVEGRAPETAAK
jgi:release factor glutamine methyltransferase